MRLLLVTWDGAGNVPPELSLLSALDDAGHETHALTHDVLRGRVEATGARFHPILHAGQLDSRRPDEKPPEIIDRALMSGALLDDVDDVLAKVDPDVVVADSMLLLVAAKFAQGPRPSVAFHHTLGDFLFGGFLDQVSFAMKERGDGVLAERGLAPYERPVEAVSSARLILSATFAAFDEPCRPLPTHFVHVGPLRRAGSQTSAPPPRRHPERPFVVVSLSTSHMEHLPLLQRIADALGRTETEALITTGPALSPAELRLPDNVAAVELVDHDRILSTTDLLVNHAGHGTVAAAASHGTPMLCVPIGRDQPMVAARAEALGLAHVCHAGASVEELAQAVTGALDDRELAGRTREFADSVEGHPGAAHAVAQIEALTSQPEYPHPR